MLVEDRPYQIRVVNNTLKAVTEGHKSVLIESPTGSGKTIMALRIAKKLIEERNWRVGWTCMRKAILHQAEVENLEKFQLPIHYFSTFTHNTLPELDVLIEDEAQHSASDTSVTIYNAIKPKLHLAMTATPYRADRMKLCFSSVIKDAGIRQLIDEGWLSPYHLYLADVIWEPATVASIYLNDIERWGKSVMFFNSVDQCFECARILEDAGVRVGVVWAGSDQDALIEKFHKDELTVLLSVMVLTEGFDEPTLKTVFIRTSPSKGPIVQMGGRGLRKHVLKPHAQLVQSTKTKWPFTRIASCEQKFKLENGQWAPVSACPKKVTQGVELGLKMVRAAIKDKLPEYVEKRRSAFSSPAFRRRRR
jgi:superfamily II DNA or RNA helicase